MYELGMPMSKPDDFGGGNPANPYCAHCTHKDGSLKSYEDIFNAMVQSMMTSHHLDTDAAEEKVRAYLAGMPAWEK